MFHPLDLQVERIGSVVIGISVLVSCKRRKVHGKPTILSIPSGRPRNAPSLIGMKPRLLRMGKKLPPRLDDFHAVLSQKLLHHVF